MVKGNDVSYSGLLTASLAKLSAGERLEDVCYSMQEVACSMLAEAVERSLAYTGKKKSLLPEVWRLTSHCKKSSKKWRKFTTPLRYTVKPALTGDNGAQIAWTGVLSMQAGLTTLVKNSRVKPKWRLEDVDIPWRN